MATIEIAHGHITVADLNDGHTPSIDVGADGRLVIDGVPKGPSLKGEDAEPVARYEIVPSDNSIMRDFKGVLTPARLTARVFRDTGIAMQEVTLGGSNSLRYSIDGGTEQTYSPASGIATGGAKQKITLTFYVGVIRWASLDVPVHGIRAQLDSSGNLTIGEAVVNVRGPKPVLSLNAQHQLVADGVLVSDTVLKGTDGITPEIDPTTKRWKIGGTLTQVKAEGTDGQPGTPGTPGKDFKYTDFTAAQLDALQSGVKSKIDTSTFRSDIGGLIKADVKTLLKNDSGFVALTKGEPGTPGANGTNGRGFKVLICPSNNANYYPYNGALASWNIWIKQESNWQAGNLADIEIGDTVCIRGVITDLDNTPCQCIGVVTRKASPYVYVRADAQLIYGKKGAQGLKGNDGKTFRPSFSGETLTFTASTDTSNVSLSGIATKAFVEGKGYQTAANVNSIVDAKGYLTQSGVDGRVKNLVPEWARATSKPKYTAAEVGVSLADGKITIGTSSITPVTSLSGYATQSWVNGKGFQTEANVNTIINGKGFATTAALNSGLAGKANSSDVSPRWHFSEAAQRSSGYYKIKINSTASWMLAFTVRIYASYRTRDILICGYNYPETKSWHDPRAIYKSGEADTSVIFGKDGNNDLWVAIPANDYTGLDIFDVTNGYTQISIAKSLFTITYVTSLSGTVVSNQALSRPVSPADRSSLQTSINAKLNTSDFTFGKIGGTATAAQIPNLDASKITAGTFGADRIPNLNASKITAGTLVAERIPTLPIAKVSNLQTTLDGKCTLAQVEGKGYQTLAQVNTAITNGVPAWARASAKPTYAYTEITGRITKVSELTNDRGYLFLSSGGCVTDQADTCAVLPYAAKTHNHDTVYAAKTHTHSEYGASGHKHTSIQAPYSGSGGKQPPTYANANELRACMSNETVNGNSQYKNWIYINAYAGNDVGGTTAIGLNRQSLGAYIMRANAGSSTWAQSAELLHTSNGLLALRFLIVNWKSNTSIGFVFRQYTDITLTPDANGFHFTPPSSWGLVSTGANVVLIANLKQSYLPVNAFMHSGVIYVVWSGTLVANATGNVTLMVLKCP